MKILILGLMGLFSIDIIDRCIDYWFYNVENRDYNEEVECDRSNKNNR